MAGRRGCRPALGVTSLGDEHADERRAREDPPHPEPGAAHRLVDLDLHFAARAPAQHLDEAVRAGADGGRPGEQLWSIWAVGIANRWSGGLTRHATPRMAGTPAWRAGGQAGRRGRRGKRGGLADMASSDGAAGRNRGQRWSGCRGGGMPRKSVGHDSARRGEQFDVSTCVVTGSEHAGGGSAKAHRPTAEQLAAAATRRLPDVVAPRLDVLFCGINPGLYSTAVGHHFARPGNRFWPALFGAGFTPRLLSPFEDTSLLTMGLGITNLVSRTTASASQLTKAELLAGGRRLMSKVNRLAPKVLAMVGLGAYRQAFGEQDAACGLQDRVIGSTRVWLLPNPSGLNAHHQVADLSKLFGELREYARAEVRSPRSRRG